MYPNAGSGRDEPLCKKPQRWRIVSERSPSAAEQWIEADGGAVAKWTRGRSLIQCSADTRGNDEIVGRRFPAGALKGAA